MPSASFDADTYLSKPGPGKKSLQYQNKQVIYVQAEAGSSVFYLQKGHVKLSVTSLSGKEAVVALLGPRDFFGHECLAGQRSRLSSAKAMGACHVAQIQKPVLSRMIRQESAFSEIFMAYLLTHIIRVEGDLVDHLSNSSEKRLARTLLLLSRFAKTSKPATIHMPRISQETLAEMVGTTRARINFFMNKFRKLGFVDYNGILTINRSLMNVILHD